MAGVKGTEGPGDNGAVETATKSDPAIPSAGETLGAEPVRGAAEDPIARVAAAVASGEMGQAAAVEQILADIMGAPVVAGAPQALRNEIHAMLTQLLEEDPHLQSLRAAIAPKEGE